MDRPGPRLVGWLLAAACACAPPAADLVVANNADPASLDPQLVSDAPAGRVVSALYRGLTRLDSVRLTPLPELARCWRSEDAGRTWIFELRPHLTWSDGTPLTATDFAASWRRLVDPATGAPYRSWLDGLVRLEAEDRRLLVSFDRPQPTFPAMCAFHALAAVPPGVRSGRQEAGWVASGPFRLEARRIRDRVRLVANPRYWDADAVRLQSIDFLVVESQFTALNLFLTGQADYVPEVPALAVPALLRREEERRRRGLRPEFAPAPFLATYFLRLNVTRPPLDDPRVRRALALAVDRARLAATLGGGQPPAGSFVPPGMPGYRPPAEPVAGDPEAARRLLAEAGFPGGAGFPVFTLSYNSAEIHRDVAEALQAVWRRVLGIRLRLENQEWKVFLDGQRRLAYDLSRSSWIADFPDPANFLEVFRSGEPNNRTGWSDPEYDRLLDRAREESDPRRRLELLARAEEILLARGPILPLFFYASHDLVAGRLRDFPRSPIGWIDWGRVGIGDGPEEAME
ncbi:MAG: peptide ABC transporter substrate-binding protein [Planctomycetota bacterium]|nr:MAG: peptide ABC transporter substrate-binding protein [Planctomycetota bacterium]